MAKLYAVRARDFFRRVAFVVFRQALESLRASLRLRNQDRRWARHDERSAGTVNADPLVGEYLGGHPVGRKPKGARESAEAAIRTVPQTSQWLWMLKGQGLVFIAFASAQTIGATVFAPEFAQFECA